jgi:hypothetical protein
VIERQAEVMAIFCQTFGLTPTEYKGLTLAEVKAFWKVVEPKTDLTGLI